MTQDILTSFLVSSIFVAAAVFALWMLSLRKQDVSIMGKFWAMGFAGIAVLSLLAKLHMPGSNKVLGGFFWFMTNKYMLLLTLLPIIWAVRYSVYVIKRSWGYGEDMRFTALRDNVTDVQWPLYSLRKVFLLQGFAMLVIAAPIWVGIGSAFFMQAPEFAPYTLPDGTWVRSASKMVSAPMGIFAIMGALVWLCGFLFEAVGDWQLVRFKNQREKLGVDVTGMVLDKGLWRITRHPNYFGNALMWWGLWLIACQTPWGWLTIISPLLMTYILVRVTGVPILEHILTQRPEYAAYMERTPVFVPFVGAKGEAKQKTPAKGPQEEAFFANMDTTQPEPDIKKRPTRSNSRRRRAEQFAGRNYNTWP